MIKEHDRVVLKKEVPDQGLKTGDVGTVITLAYSAPRNRVWVRLLFIEGDVAVC
jgi:hypothetical protein